MNIHMNPHTLYISFNMSVFFKYAKCHENQLQSRKNTFMTFQCFLEKEICINVLVPMALTGAQIKYKIINNHFKN